LSAVTQGEKHTELGGDKRGRGGVKGRKLRWGDAEKRRDSGDVVGRWRKEFMTLYKGSRGVPFLGQGENGEGHSQNGKPMAIALLNWNTSSLNW